MTEITKLYITITTKPIAIAAAEHLPAVEAKLDMSKMDGDDLLQLVTQAANSLEGAGSESD